MFCNYHFLFLLTANSQEPRAKSQLKKMTTIYHNPRCSKSRETLGIIEQHVSEIKIIKYLDTPLTVTELTDLLSKLGIKPIDLIRTNEAIWKEHYKGKTLNDQELINAMVNHPKLIERPIVVKGNKAIIGRPPSRVLDIL